MTGAWAVGARAAWGAKQGMDAIYPILSQTTGANSAGQSSASDTAEAGAFDALLAGQTTPVTPVPAIPSRPNGGFAPSPSNPTQGAQLAMSASSTSAGTASGPVMATQTQASATTNLQTTALPASPTTGAHPQDGAVLQPNTAAQGGSASGAPSTSPATVSAEGGQNAAGPGTSQTAPESGNATVASNSAAKTPAAAPSASTVNAKAAAEPSIKNNVTPAATGASNTGEIAGSNSAGTVKTNAATPAANAVAGATAQISDGQAASTAASTASQPVVQAGVQARREAAGPDKAPIAGNSKSTASGSAGAANATNSSASSTTTQTAKPDITVQTQTPAPQTAQTQADAPLDPARLAVSDNARSAPPPADPGQTDAAADAERVDMSNSRAAEISRVTERPGVAAGTARFTPAHAGTLAAQIAAKFQNGDRKFEIRMDPPELGRIQVKMHVGNDNRVQAILSAERPETLNDLRQHARELERALEESGLQLDNDGLSFELSQGRDDDEHMPRNLPGFTNIEFAEDLAGPITAAALPRELYGFQLSAVGRVDVRL
ncbi:flagellar hook-length control protein FliK [Hyphobacterium sp.]|uniref:flagellar hook-length control protein FliK n=1 Tax=Hyphobacterium sp. TaxID=2004662 RepID=UPI003748EB09